MQRLKEDSAKKLFSKLYFGALHLMWWKYLMIFFALCPQPQKGDLRPVPSVRRSVVSAGCSAKRLFAWSCGKQGSCLAYYKYDCKKVTSNCDFFLSQHVSILTQSSRIIKYLLLVQKCSLVGAKQPSLLCKKQVRHNR